MKAIPSRSELRYLKKFTDFFKYFLIALLLLTSFHLLAYGNNPETIIQPEWTANLKASTQLITTGEQVFVIEEQKDNSETKDYSAILFAINTASGKVQWQQKLPFRQSPGNRQLILENGTIYASHDDGVTGFNPKTGSPKTSFKYAEDMNSRNRDRLMGIHQDILIYGDSIPIDKSDFSRTGYQSKVFGITKDKTIWSYQLPKSNVLIGGISAIEPVVQNGILLLPSRHETTAGWIEQFTVMDVVSGKVLWTWEVPREPDGLGLRSVNVFGDTLFYTSVFDNSKMQMSERLHAINLKTGKEKWSYVITDQTNWRTKAASDREVLVWQSKDNVGGNFVVLDKETGRFLRRFIVPLGYHAAFQPLAWEDGRIYIEALEPENETVEFSNSVRNSWLGAFDDKTGKLVWRTSSLINSSIDYPPVVSPVADKSEKKRLIFASNFFDIKGGSKMQSFLIP
jgi:outer membrane protein assembly factor BamB